ncbi:hypothetical protein OIU84_016368 [Salix udensis]|uniref:Non-haem dioxygenase N-terminal domain-containing protein n=1 Tax=Salix udensis TaxID=889485 RepID=A0AAD6JB81_9ROSI|nr:hypothetical protein OIU84_016368 [Salix udensis]
MVVPSPTPRRTKKTKALGIPTIDLSLDSSNVSRLIVRACEEYGFFKVINHGVDKEVVTRLEEEAAHFFRENQPWKSSKLDLQLLSVMAAKTLAAMVTRVSLNIFSSTPILSPSLKDPNPSRTTLQNSGNQACPPVYSISD